LSTFIGSVQDEQGGLMAIIKNAIQRKKCGDIIESVSVHDFKTCSCGACSVDGGHDYLKRCANSLDDFIDLTETQGGPGACKAL